MGVRLRRVSMRMPNGLRSPLRRVAVVFVALVALATASPAAAQYGGSPQLIVDPVRVPIDSEFDAFGQACPAASTVTITIDGFPQVLASGTAGDDSVYSIPGVAMPAGVVAGSDYNVRASCSGDSAIFLITAVCNDGTDPLDGECQFGNTVGGEPDPGTTTTTTAGGTTGGGTNGGSSGGTNLAVTGTETIQWFAMIGATLVAAGFALVLVAGRRDDQVTA